MEQMLPNMLGKQPDIIFKEEPILSKKSELSPFDIIQHKINIAQLDQSWVEANLKEYHNFFFMESLLALMLLVILGPFLLIVSALIYLDSPGGVIFKQQRVGFGGKKFLIFKFRSMIQDAEKVTGAVWAQKNDTRITRLGHWLRKLRIDELPQLVNVIKGDMRLIGPRPERPEFVELLSQSIPFYQVRHRVKPGITGWAQVKYSYGASVNDSAEKLAYDLFYIKNRSLILDIEILLRTLWVVVKGKGR